jgi:gliding motility-associated-like protein
VDTVIITNQGGTYTYAWTLDGSPFAQTSASITITSGGTYEVTATNTSTGCETSKTIVVDESEFPLFDRDDLTVFDLTGNGSNRIEVLTGIVALGIGDYEFSLDGGPYQDTPIFEDVPPGIHQVSVRDKIRDKNGCGTKSIDVSVIGYPLYFTPNGNGKDDYWQVLGVNAVFQSQSLIYIFDRHGRLLAQIPTDGPGWDGTYNGTPMPADDYWFRVKLEDGRTFTGHFSLMR